MNELVERIILRLSEDEKRVLGSRFVQLTMEGGDIGITIETHDKVPPSTIKSLIARGLAKAKPDKRTGIMPLTGFGVKIAERVRANG